MSWPLVKLGDHVEILSGFAFKSELFNSTGEGLPLVRIRDVVPGVSETYYCGEYSDEFLVFDGDLLVGMDGDFNRERWSGGRSLLNQRVCKITANTISLDQCYLYHFLPKALAKIHAETPAVTVKHLSVKGIRAIKIPLPPLPEQKRIAAILDKADAIRRKRQQAIQLADDFLRAVFLDMFGDPVTNTKGWDIRAVKEMAKVTTGNTPPRDKPEYYGDFIEWIKSDNINTPSDFLTIATEYLSEAGCMVGRRVPAGSTLLTCIAGSFDCIGNSAYTDREVSFNQQINALTPMPGVNGIFLYALAKYCKKAIQAASTGGMKGMVSKGKLEEVRFICPPESMQQKFAEVFHRYQGLRKGMEHSLDGLSDEFSSISQRAFSGHL